MKRIFVLLFLIAAGPWLLGQAQTRTLPVTEVHGLTDIHELLPDNLQDVPVVSFEITWRRGNSNEIIIRKNQGSTFGEGALELVLGAVPGDHFWFDNIRYELNGEEQRTSVSVEVGED